MTNGHLNAKEIGVRLGRNGIRQVRNASKHPAGKTALRFFPLGRTVVNAITALDKPQVLANFKYGPEEQKMGKMRRDKKYGIIGASLFSFGILFGWVAFPAILKSQIKNQVALKPGAEMRELWSNFPLPLDFKIYLFNVTNAEEVTKGAKPIVNEIGPYFFDEYKVKLDLVDREEDDSLEYSQKATWFFNPSKSNGLTGEEIIVMPHLVIVGLAMATLQEKPTAMGIINKAVDSIFKKPSSAFMTEKAMDIMFRGLPIDCTVKDFAGSAVCSVMKQESKDLEEISENLFKFSLFGSKNGTILPERMRVLRGIKNYKDLGRVIEWNNQPALTIWPEDHCNAYNGTDSTIFPPLMTVPDDDIVSFAPELCRSIGAHYHSMTNVKGVTTAHYTADLGDMSKNEMEKCFCPTPETCLSKNLYDLTKCIGLPLVASLPHFFGSEPYLLSDVKGLHPEEEKHGILMDFEPMTATPLSGRKRLQFNMMIHPHEKFRLLKTFPDVLFPFFWVEEGILLDDEFVDQVKQAFMLITIVTCVKWLFVLSGIVVGGIAIYIRVKKHGNEQNVDITKVTPQTVSRKESGQEKKWPQMNISTVQAANIPASVDRN